MPSIENSGPEQSNIKVCTPGETIFIPLAKRLLSVPMKYPLEESCLRVSL